MTTYAHDISPDVLAGGEWVLDRRARVLRWVAAPVVAAPEPPPLPRPASEIVVCSACNATMDQPCRTQVGKARHPHSERVGSRTCACGAQPSAPKARYCDPCRVVRRRETFRESQKRRYKREERARLQAMVDAIYGEPANWQTEGEVA